MKNIVSRKEKIATKYKKYKELIEEYTKIFHINPVIVKRNKRKYEKIIK